MSFDKNLNRSSSAQAAAFAIGYSQSRQVEHLLKPTVPCLPANHDYVEEYQAGRAAVRLEDDDFKVVIENDVMAYVMFTFLTYRDLSQLN